MENSNTNKSLKELESKYLDGNYADVLHSHLEIKDSLSRGHFHYNLGTIYAKEGKIGAARYNLEKAKIDGFTYPGLDKNLDSVTKMIGTPKLTFKEALIINYLSSSVQVSLLISLLILMVVLLFKKARLIKRRWTLTILIVLSFVPVALKIGYIDKAYKIGINITSIKMFEGPSEIYPVVLEIPEGQKIVTEKMLDDWYLVSFPREFSGWIKKNDIGLLK